ncbi:futalosine hydrolase [Candidatus Riflebacteria bacterium]
MDEKRSQLIICPTFRELKSLLQSLPEKSLEKLGAEFFSLCQKHWLLATCGVGLSFPPIRTMELINKYNIESIHLYGICGAKKNSGISQGDIIHPDKEIFMDLGCYDGKNFHDLQTLGLAHHSSLKEGNQIHLSVCRDFSLKNPYKIHIAALGSRNQICGTDTEAEFWFKTWPQILGENMEGASIALLASHLGLPFYEVRAVSNYCGNRDRANWNCTLALQNLTEIFQQARDIF